MTSPASTEQIDPADIEAAIQQLPEAASLFVWLIGGSCAGAISFRRRLRDGAVG